MIYKEGGALGFGLWALGFGLWTLDFGLWTLDFGLWTSVAHFRLILTIDFTAEQNGCARQIKPQHQNNQRAQRSVCGAVGVEEMQVEAKAQRDQQPQQHREEDAG